MSYLIALIYRSGRVIDMNFNIDFIGGSLQLIKIGHDSLDRKTVNISANIKLAELLIKR